MLILVSVVSFRLLVVSVFVVYNLFAGQCLLILHHFFHILDLTHVSFDCPIMVEL